MNRFCPQCGQPQAQREPNSVPDSLCPACGALLPLQSTPEDQQEYWRQTRRRATLGIAVIVATLIAAFFWLLLQPTPTSSPGRLAKNAFFGPRIADAVEQAAQRASGSRASRGNASTASNSSNSRSNSPTRTGAESGNAAESGAAPGEGTAGPGGQNTRDGGQTRPRGSRNSTESTPGNDQRQPSEGPAPDAPPERSIGFLDWFLGRSPNTGPARAGEGGTGSQPGRGNNGTNAPNRTAEQIASDLPDTPAVIPDPFDLNRPPSESPRTTNRQAPSSEANLNDNIGRVLSRVTAGTGDVRISLVWSNINDLDLHVVDPSGEELNYGHRSSRSGGLHDLDMNANGPLRSPAVENVYWPTRAAPAGAYKVYVNHYMKKATIDQTPFTVRILIRGRTHDVHGTVKYRQPKLLVEQFTLPAAN